MDKISEKYFRILQQASLAADGQQVEEHLAAAYEMGRSLVDRMAPPDEMASMHHQAIVRLSQAFPDLILDQLADRLTLPLLEMSMAYGVAFREHTERQDSAREANQYRELALSAADLGAWAISPESEVITLDDQTRRMLELPSEGGLSIETILLHVHPEDRNRVAAVFNRVPIASDSSVHHEEARVQRSDGSLRWLALDSRRYERFGLDGSTTKCIGVASDITGRKNTERHLRDLLRLHAVLSDVNQTIVRQRDPQLLLQAVCRIAVEKGQFRMAWVGLINPETQSVRIAASSGFVDGYLEPQEFDWCLAEYAGRPLVRSILAKADVICNDIEQEPEHLTWKAAALRRGYRSVGSFPLLINDQVVGVFSLYSAEVGAFDTEEIKLLDGMAMDISFALDVHRQEQVLRRAEAAVRETSDFLKEAQKIGTLGCYVLDVSSGTWATSEGLDSIFGIARDFERSIEGWASLIHPEDVDMMLRYFWSDVVEKRKPFDEQYRIIRPSDGQLRWVHGLGTLEFDKDGKPLKMRGIIRDITVEKLAVMSLQESEARYRAAFETSLDAISITDFNTRRIIDVNDAFLAMTGYSREEIVGRLSSYEGLWADLQDRDRVMKALRQESVVNDLEVKLRRKDGTTYWATISASIFDLGDKTFTHAVIRDVSQAKQAEDEIKNLAFFDQLTGLANRRFLLEQLKKCAASSGHSQRKYALFFMDLDNFKIVNDSYGHHTGDHLLRQVAKRLVGTVRKTDIVARLGGDEFVVVISDLDDRRELAVARAEDVAAKIGLAISRPYLIDGAEFHSSCSIGVTLFGEERLSVSEVLQQGDIAMYQAKAAGRNAVRFFAPELQSMVSARASLEEEIRRGIKQSEFVLYYQPQIVEDRIAGAEALIRWKHPERGLLNPGIFIPLAEETQLIIPLGNWVIQEACRQLARWAEFRGTAAVVLAVNITALQFRSHDFVEIVLDAVQRTGADPHLLKLELTESVLVEDTHSVIEKMNVLKSHGIGIALDDFGTGYSSLAYLNRLPLDQLKIDCSFVQNICADQSSAKIAQTIISLGRAMRLDVIAEGVETQEQMDVLLGLGCHAFQGFLFAPPLPASELERGFFDLGGRSV